jgi:hypothetical protein
MLFVTSRAPRAGLVTAGGGRPAGRALPTPEARPEAAGAVQSVDFVSVSGGLHA